MKKFCGIGIDIVKIDRFRKIPLNDITFYKKILSEYEILLCKNSNLFYEYLGISFAIKEAVIKSIPEKITFLDIETYNKKSKISINIISPLKNKYSFIVSHTFDKNLAVGVVLSFYN